MSTLQFRPVQLATLASAVPTGDGWLHELKYDGYRLLLVKHGVRGVAFTRSGLDWSNRFEPLLRSLGALKARSLSLDGEVVVLDAKGRSSFQALQGALKSGRRDYVFYAFDLLNLDGRDLRNLPLIKRKQALHRLIGAGVGAIKYSEHVAGPGQDLFRRMCKAGGEGIVSKRADAPYRGERTESWVKVKCTRRQEFIIVGWTPSDKQRHFRSLLLGVYDEGVLRFAGKVGTGFDEAELQSLHARMVKLARSKPTVVAPGVINKTAHWIAPRLVAEIGFTEMTSDGLLRHPTYLGLREDKPASKVVIEKPKPARSLTAKRRRAKLT